MRSTGFALLLASLLSLPFLGGSAFAQTPAYFPITSNACNAYPGLVKSYGASYYWRFLETSGTSAADSVGSNDGDYQGSPTLGVVGPLIAPSKGVVLNGSSQYVSTPYLTASPSTFTLIIWFKTTTTSGGKLIGYGISRTGTSSSYDRHIYMTNAGNIVFGVYNSATYTITSSSTYNDGQWHMAAATFSSSGMSLSVDGGAIQSNLNSGVSAFNGYWRIGFDNVTGWPSAPSSPYFAGTVSEAAVFDGVVLTPAQISELYSIGASCTNYNAPAAGLVFGVGPQTVNDNACSAATYVSTNTLSSTPLTVNISAPNTTFYSDQYCTQSITSTTIPAYSYNSSSFYFLTTAVGSTTATAAASGFTSGTQTETVASNPYRWVGGGGDSNWSTGANWSGGSAPGNANVALFDGTCVSNCSPTISTDISVAGVRIISGYTGTITQSSSTIIMVGAKGWIQAAGTFAGSSGTNAITIAGPLYVQGGSYQSTSGTLTLRNHFAISGSGSFAHHSGTILLQPVNGAGTVALSIGSTQLNHLTIQADAGYDTYTLAFSGTINVAGNLSILAPTGGTAPTISGGTFAVSGNVTTSGIHRFLGSALIRMVNSTNATLTGGGISFPIFPIEIASTGGTTTIAGTPFFAGGFTYTSGTVAVSATDVYFALPYLVTTSLTTGSIQFNNVHFYTISNYDNWTLNLSGNLTVLGSLYLDAQSPSGYSYVNGNSINVSGDIVATGGHELRGTSQIVVAGSTNQTVSAAAGTSLPSINIASTGGTVTLSGSLLFRRSLIYTSGTVDASASSITFDPVYATTGTITPGTIAFNDVTFASASQLDGYVLTLTAPITVNGALTLSQSGGTLATLNGSSIIANGNVTSSGSSYFLGTTTLTIGGSTNTTITAGTSNNSLLRTSLTVNKTGGATATLASALSLNNAGQAMTISSGTLDMAGFGLSVNGALTLSSGTMLTKSGGTLTYGSLSNSGTINP